MTPLKLIDPTPDLQADHNEMLNEWLQTRERLIPYSLQYDTSDFRKYIDKLTNAKLGVGLLKTFVPVSTFWLTNDSNKILGTVDIRHQLTPSLMIEGGHIGYGIRPSERKKGYATTILELALKEAKKLHIDKALVTCGVDNIGSKKTILKNNGTFYKENLLDGKIKLSFWIDL